MSINDLVRVRGDRKRRECVFERDRGARHFARVGGDAGGGGEDSSYLYFSNCETL